MDKKEYEPLELNLLLFEPIDVITFSNNGANDELGDDIIDWGWDEGV